MLYYKLVQRPECNWTSGGDGDELASEKLDVSPEARTTGWEDRVVCRLK
jgi:hypothetical protein